MPLDSREERMQLFSGFTQQVESVRPDAVDRISEVDLSDAHDLRATLTGFEPVVATSATPDSQPPLARGCACDRAFWRQRFCR